MNTSELKQRLSNFHGTELWYRHSLNRNMLYTDGVQFFADNAGNGAYWFIDIVVTELMPLLKNEPFIHIKLEVLKNEALIRASDGNEDTIWSRKIEYTDCPEGAWHFYLIDNVLLLPSEY